MRIAVVAFDTRGGVEPYVALAGGLSRAGHDVRVVTSPDFAQLVASHDLAVAPVSGAVGAVVETSDSLAEMGRIERSVALRRLTRELVVRSAGETLDACAGVELVTAGIGGMAVGRPVAEKLGVGFMAARLQPVGPATATFPGVFLPSVPSWLGGPGRRASHVVTRLAVDGMLRAAARAARTEVLGLPARPAPVHPDLPSVYGFSRHVVPKPPEWGPDRHVTGYWTLPISGQWAPPAELAEFVDCGPPPVCIGFGSMTSADPVALTALVVDAVRRAGVRAVLLTGWGALVHPRRAGDDVFVTGAVPHGWLSATALGAALGAVVADPSMRARAQALGARIREDDGVANAVAVYDRVARRLA